MCWFWDWMIWRLSLEQEWIILSWPAASGITGKLSQLHISIMNPSGSWKNSWSTYIPPSSTFCFTYFISNSPSFFSTFLMLSHCSVPIHFHRIIIKSKYACIHAYFISLIYNGIYIYINQARYSPGKKYDYPWDWFQLSLRAYSQGFLNATNEFQFHSQTTWRWNIYITYTRHRSNEWKKRKRKIEEETYIYIYYQAPSKLKDPGLLIGKNPRTSV